MNAPVIAALFDSLDAITYFFVSSGVFLLFVAAVFFSLGLALGSSLWRRYKARYHEADRMIESMKNEVAFMKRRVAEQPRVLAPPAPARLVTAAATAASSFPDNATATNLPVSQETAIPASAAFSLWTSPETGSPTAATPSHTPPRMGIGEMLLRSLKEPVFAPSRAFTIWTAADWRLHPGKGTALPRGAGFSIWTNAERTTLGDALPPSRAGTIWTAPDWEPPPMPFAPNAPARGFSLWTEWEPTGVNGSIFSSMRAHHGALRGRNPAEVFRAEIERGEVRNDFRLGIIYQRLPGHPDNLLRIPGITPSLRDALQAHGVHTFRQIALWTGDQAQEFAWRLGLKNRHDTMHWVIEAGRLQELRAGGDIS